MDIQQYLDEMRKIQENLLIFLDGDHNDDENFSNLIKLFDDLKIREDKHILKQLLYLITRISGNYHRGPNFFHKLEQILNFFKNEIKKYFSNLEIFNIFKSNKRILLLLIEENIMIFDEKIAKTILLGYEYLEKSYSSYFLPEIRPFVNKQWFPTNNNNKLMGRISNKLFKLIEIIKDDLPEDFYEKRRIGENDSKICEVIRNGSLKEFIAFINKNDISLDSTIKESIYESNNFLVKETYERKSTKDKNITMIEYATFYGSLSIVKYLKAKGVRITNSIWNYAVHCQNPSIIHFIEECDVKPVLIKYNLGNREVIQSYVTCFKEAIKCHNNQIVNYIQNNYINNDELNTESIVASKIKSFNFEVIDLDMLKNESFVLNLCKYDYYIPVCFHLKRPDFDINKEYDISKQ